MDIQIGDSERRTAAELALRLPTWTDGAVRDALRRVAFTTFIRSIDEVAWRALIEAALADIDAEKGEGDETDEDQDERENHEARAVFNFWRRAE
jgi:hypothetical protein